MSDADVEVEGAPVAPLDVRCHDANKDYVVVTWKQPAVEGSSPIVGYFIDRSLHLPLVQQSRLSFCAVEISVLRTLEKSTQTTSFTPLD